MNTTYNIKEKTGYTPTRVSYSFEEAKTFEDNRFRLNKAAVVAEAKSIIQDADFRYLRAMGLPQIDSDYCEEEELAWDAFFAQPNVQSELERLAEEAERQFAAGETEEGGFAVE